MWDNLVNMIGYYIIDHKQSTQVTIVEQIFIFKFCLYIKLYSVEKFNNISDIVKFEGIYYILLLFKYYIYVVWS